MSRIEEDRAALQAVVNQGLEAQRALGAFKELANSLYGQLDEIVGGSSNQQTGRALEIYMGLPAQAELMQGQLEDAGMAVTIYAASL
jgi:hypothetical protein